MKHWRNKDHWVKDSGALNSLSRGTHSPRDSAEWKQSYTQRAPSQKDNTYRSQGTSTARHLSIKMNPGYSYDQAQQLARTLGGICGWASWFPQVQKVPWQVKEPAGQQHKPEQELKDRSGQWLTNDMRSSSVQAEEPVNEGLLLCSQAIQPSADFLEGTQSMPLRRRSLGAGYEL